MDRTIDTTGQPGGLGGYFARDLAAVALMFPVMVTSAPSTEKLPEEEPPLATGLAFGAAGRAGALGGGGGGVSACFFENIRG